MFGASTDVPEPAATSGNSAGELRGIVIWSFVRYTAGHFEFNDRHKMERT